MNFRKLKPAILFPVIILVAALAGGIAKFGWKFFEDNSKNDKIIAAANEINKKTPITVDHLLVLDFAVADGAALVYNFRMPELSSAEIDADFFTAKQKIRSVNYYCGEKNLATLRRNKVALIYKYHANDGKIISQIRVGVENCQESSEPEYKNGEYSAPTLTVGGFEYITIGRAKQINAEGGLLSMGGKPGSFLRCKPGLDNEKCVAPLLVK